MTTWPNLFKLVIRGEFDKYLYDMYLFDAHKTTSRYSSILHFAVLGGNIETIQYLIENNVNVNSRNMNGETPLHWCCKEGNIEIAKLLIHHGANYTLTDFDRNSPLHWAVEYNNHEIVSYLLSKEVPLNGTNTNLLTPLKLAKLNYSKESMVLLKKYFSLQNNETNQTSITI